MSPRPRIRTACPLGLLLCWALLLFVTVGRAASLETFAVVFGQVTKGGQVMTFRMPVVTEDVSYEVDQGLATLNYTADIFSDTPEVAATSGTFFVQRERNEIYGVFSVAGPGLEVKDGRFRIQLPRTLRGSE